MVNAFLIVDGEYGLNDVHCDESADLDMDRAFRMIKKYKERSISLGYGELNGSCDTMIVDCALI